MSRKDETLKWPDPEDITVSYHTLAGNRHGEPAVNKLLARAKAARDAGLRSIGVCIDDYTNEQDLLYASGWLDSAGMSVGEVEWLELSGRHDGAAEDTAMHMAQVLHVQRVCVGYCATEAPDMATVVRRLGTIGLKALYAGTDVAVESVAFGSLSSITQVQDLVGRVNLPNVGTLLDTWQLARMAWTPSVDDIDPALVRGVQICGVDAPPLQGFAGSHELFLDAQNARRLPHEGGFPVRDWVTSLLAAGVTTPLACEVISDELRAMDVGAAALQVSKSLAALVPEKELDGALN